jgi:hypothetical protein
MVAAHPVSRSAGHGRYLEVARRSHEHLVIRPVVYIGLEQLVIAGSFGRFHAVEDGMGSRRVDAARA